MCLFADAQRTKNRRGQWCWCQTSLSRRAATRGPNFIRSMENWDYTKSTYLWASFWENRSFPTMSDKNRAVQPLKMARHLKFWIKKEEVLYYLCCENKGADQLRNYCAADLRFCSRICENPVFPERGSCILRHECFYHFIFPVWLDSEKRNMSIVHYN